VPLDRILPRPSWLQPRARTGSPEASRWRLLEGRPFERRPRLAILSPAVPEAGGTAFELLRETAREFDVLLFAFADRVDDVSAPLLDLCARIILVERPRRSLLRSDLMQTLWNGFCRELGAELRQVEGTTLAGYGGDVLIAEAEAPRAAWRRWRYERALRPFRRVLTNGDADPAGRARIYREMMDPIAIRKAGEADVAELDRIQHLSTGAVIWEPASYLAYDCRVAELNGRVAGFVVCRMLPQGESEVLSLVVDPAARRHGLGTRLMLAVLDQAPSTTWYLEVRESNWPARKLYIKLGFLDVATRPNYYQDTGETAVVMRR
jgi:ribosomal protein S18 acetylase RimI-like enzyme